MKKKVIALFLITVLTTSLLSACGKDKEEPEENPTAVSLTGEEIPAQEDFSDTVPDTIPESVEPTEMVAETQPQEKPQEVASSVSETENNIENQSEANDSGRSGTNSESDEISSELSKRAAENREANTERRNQRKEESREKINAGEDPVVQEEGPVSEEKEEEVCPTTVQNLDKVVDNNINLFNWKYYGTLNASKNQLYAPFSIAQIFALLGSGADANTLTQNEVLLTFGAVSIEQLNILFQTTVYDLMINNWDGVTNNYLMQSLIVGNTAKGYLYKDNTFVDNMKKYYFFDVIFDNFQTNLLDLKNKIIIWVNTATGGQIPAFDALIIPESPADVVNTAYFKAEWEKPFSTTTGNAKCITGEMKQCDLLTDTRNIRYYTDGKYCGIILPYKQQNDGKTSMYLIMPADKTSTNVGDSWGKEDASYRCEFIKKLSASTTTDVNVTIPKFSVESGSESISERMKQLGIVTMFTGNSEIKHFMGYLSKTAVGNIFHKTKIVVTESGVCDSATSTATIEGDAEETTTGTTETTSEVVSSEGTQFSCTIPFVFVIRDEKHGVDLFTGIINEF